MDRNQGRDLPAQGNPIRHEVAHGLRSSALNGRLRSDSPSSRHNSTSWARRPWAPRRMSAPSSHTRKRTVSSRDPRPGMPGRRRSGRIAARASRTRAHMHDRHIRGLACYTSGIVYHTHRYAGAMRPLYKPATVPGILAGDSGGAETPRSSYSMTLSPPGRNFRF